MKRFAAVLTALAMTAALAGCAGLNGSPATGESAGALSNTTAETTPEPTPPPTGNPLTGQEGDFGGKRPVAVALRTGEGVAPQWGVAGADVLVEGLTEGKTASLMAIYPSVDSISKVGPVGAGRDLMLQFAMPLNAVPVHMDKNVYASNLLNVAQYQDVDGYHIGTAAFSFDADRQMGGYREENCWYTTADGIRAGMENYGSSTDGDTIRLFNFGDTGTPETQNGTDLFVTFSSEDTEELVFDSSTGLYCKNNADGSPMMDADNGQQALFTNVFVLYASSGIKDDGYTRQYDLSGGTGLYLTRGAWQQISWSKGDATAPLVLTTADGSPLLVNVGKSFLAIYGGFYGQSLRLTDAEGNEQPLPEKPALLESGIPDEVAQAAEADYQAQQAAIAESEAALDADSAADSEGEADSAAEGEGGEEAQAATEGGESAAQ